MDVRHISRRFGNLIALKDVSFSARPREILGLVGPKDDAARNLERSAARGFGDGVVGQHAAGAHRAQAGDDGALPLLILAAGIATQGGIDEGGKPKET